MGASVNLVMFLLSKETLRLLGISALISIPAYFGVRSWLQNFAYHIDFNVLVYTLVLLGVTMVVLIIALLTVSYNSYQAASADIVVADGNPVVWLSRLAGRPVALVPRADLVEHVARFAAARGVPLARVGSTEDWKAQDPQVPQSIWYHTDALHVGFRIVRPLV